MMARGHAFAVAGKPSAAVQMLTSGIAAWRSTGSTMWLPLRLSQLARAHADLGEFEDARRCIDEAMTAVETTKERWFEADVLRVAGEVTLKSLQPDAPKAALDIEHMWCGPQRSPNAGPTRPTECGALGARRRYSLLCGALRPRSRNTPRNFFVGDDLKGAPRANTGRTSTLRTSWSRVDRIERRVRGLHGPNVLDTVNDLLARYDAAERALAVAQDGLA